MRGQQRVLEWRGRRHPSYPPRSLDGPAGSLELRRSLRAQVSPRLDKPLVPRAHSEAVVKYPSGGALSVAK